MDRFSAQLANALLGKSLSAPLFELHYPASEFLFQYPAIICLTGANFTPTVNDTAIPLNQPVAIAKHSVLRFHGMVEGARCYLSLLNALHVEPWLDSYSTNTKVGAGGYRGRKLLQHDRLVIENLRMKHVLNGADVVPLHWKVVPDHTPSGEVEFVIGQEWNQLTPEAQRLFETSGFVISPTSDRMGYRLQGEPLERTPAPSMISSPVTFGTVQLLPDGQLIILMADHQTTGGYPRVATVSSTSLSRLAQMNARQVVRFQRTELETAEKKLVKGQKFLREIQNECKLKMDQLPVR